MHDLRCNMVDLTHISVCRYITHFYSLHCTTCLLQRGTRVLAYNAIGREFDRGSGQVRSSSPAPSGQFSLDSFECHLHSNSPYGVHTSINFRKKRNSVILQNKSVTVYSRPMRRIKFSSEEYVSLILGPRFRKSLPVDDLSP